MVKETPLKNICVGTIYTYNKETISVQCTNTNLSGSLNTFKHKNKLYCDRCLLEILKGGIK